MSCESTYGDPTSKHSQRNLQHVVEFQPLLSNETVTQLDSGHYATCGFRINLRRKQHQLIFQVSWKIC